MANLSSYLPDGIDESSVQITGGTINGTTIGASTAAAGTFTTVTGSGDLAIDTDTLFVDVSADKVGIGTTSPSHNLDVTGGATDVSMRVGPTSSSGSNDGTLIINNGGNGDAMIRFDYESGNTDRARIGVTTSGQQLQFYTAGDNERMRIDNSGNVGIGTTSPSAKLHIDTSGTAIKAIGKVAIGPSTTANGLLTLQSDTQYTQLVEIYGAGNKSTYIAGRFGIIEDDSFSAKIGGVYGGYAGLSFEYYYIHPLIQETRNNGDLRLGESSYRFHTVYAVNGVSTSDERTKEEVENLDVGLDFIKSLQPKKFKYKDKNEEGVYKDGRLDQPNGVKKWGLIAQDVKQVLDDNSITEDLGLWSVDKGECNGEILEDQQQLQYQELIAPLINAVKEQQALIETLQTEVAELKAN